MAATEWCEDSEQPKVWTVEESAAGSDEPEDLNGKKDAAKQRC